MTHRHSQVHKIVLAALHYNENAENGQAVTHSGEPCWKVKCPKVRKAEASISSIKQAPTYGYVDHLYSLLEEYVNGGTLHALPVLPPHVTSTPYATDKASLVQSHLLRFWKQ